MSERPMQVGKRAVQLRDVEEGRGSAMMTMVATPEELKADPELEGRAKPH